VGHVGISSKAANFGKQLTKRPLAIKCLKWKQANRYMRRYWSRGWSFAILC